MGELGITDLSPPEPFDFLSAFGGSIDFGYFTVFLRKCQILQVLCMASKTQKDLGFGNTTQYPRSLVFPALSVP